MNTFIERLKFCLYILTGKYENEVKELEEFITELKYSLEFYKQEVFELESYIYNVLNKASAIEEEHEPIGYLVEAFAKYPEEE